MNVDRTRALHAQHDDETSRLVMWGWITAILVSPVGFIVGVVLLTRGRAGQGVAMMTVALVIFASLLSTAG